ncbi:MAG: hypothetical protein JO354_10295 [Verrucomicrobia bacterium]|nr:hypothetical protein [Verrucomicrobiota bacterium]
MRTSLSVLAGLAFAAIALGGCATADQSTEGTTATADSGAKPGSGPGAPPASGMPMNNGPAIGQ